MSDTYEIKLKVELDDKKVPTALSWEASAQTEGAQDIKAFMLALFDTNSRDTLKIDLWTQDMQIMEMDRFSTRHFVACAILTVPPPKMNPWQVIWISLYSILAPKRVLSQVKFSYTSSL